MIQRTKILRNIARSLGIAIALSFAVTACNAEKRLTKANVAEVTEGMSKKQVESILGPPTSVDT